MHIILGHTQCHNRTNIYMYHTIIVSLFKHACTKQLAPLHVDVMLEPPCFVYAIA